jgi:hypothetical protein
MKKLRELQIGERVRIRGFSRSGSDFDGVIGSVISFFVNNTYEVSVTNDSSDAVSFPIFKRSQLIPLKPKKKLREFWMKYFDGSKQFIESKYHDCHGPNCGCFLVREVRGKK